MAKEMVVCRIGIFKSEYWALDEKVWGNKHMNRRPPPNVLAQPVTTLLHLPGFRSASELTIAHPEEFVLFLEAC
jgi:hypothetical protein